MHLPKSMILFVLIILLSLATWKSALAQVVPRESMLGARSIAALAHDVRLGQSWPRLERSVPKDRQFARALIVKFRSEHQEVFVAPDSDTIMHYADLIGAMKTSGGYLNTVTKDTLYRLAMRGGEQATRVGSARPVG